jgi:hypothetical protein
MEVFPNIQPLIQCWCGAEICFGMKVCAKWVLGVPKAKKG